MDSLNESLGHFIQWSMFFVLVYFAYKSPGARVFGWLIGGVVILIASYRTFFTAFSAESYWFIGLGILLACFMGNKDNPARADHEYASNPITSPPPPQMPAEAMKPKVMPKSPFASYRCTSCNQRLNIEPRDKNITCPSCGAYWSIDE